MRIFIKFEESQVLESMEEDVRLQILLVNFILDGSYGSRLEIKKLNSRVLQ